MQDDVINTLGPVIMSTWTTNYVIPWKENIHPVCLGYYIKARVLMGCVCYIDDGGNITSLVQDTHSSAVVDEVSVILARLVEIADRERVADFQVSCQAIITMVNDILNDFQDT